MGVENLPSLRHTEPDSICKAAAAGEPATDLTLLNFTALRTQKKKNVSWDKGSHLCLCIHPAT